VNKEISINPLNVFGLRKVSFPPPHFEYVNMKLSYNMLDSIEKWIEKNSKKRYFIGKNIDLTKDRKIDNFLRIGFEDSKELSYFILACPYLKYN
jgi:hypothetical protein